MNELAKNQGNQDVAIYDPKEGLKTIAVAEAAEKAAKKPCAPIQKNHSRASGCEKLSNANSSSNANMWCGATRRWNRAGAGPGIN